MQFLLSKRKQEKLRFKLKIYLVLTGLLIIALISFFQIQIKPFEARCIKKEAKSVAVKLVNKAFENTVKKLNYSYSDIADIQYSDSGQVQGIEAKALEINKIKSTFMDNFQKEFDKIDVYTFTVPMGSFANINALSNAGPDIEVNFRLTGSVNCTLQNKFESAGVNQTVHHIYLIVDAEIITVSPGYSKTIKFSTDYEVAQTVIVGSVPSLYANTYRYRKNLE